MLLSCSGQRAAPLARLSMLCDKSRFREKVRPAAVSTLGVGVSGSSVLGVVGWSWWKPQISTATTRKSSDDASGSLSNVCERPLEPYSNDSSSHKPKLPPPPKPSESGAPSRK